MRFLLTLIVLAAAGYVGFNYYQDHYAGKSSAGTEAVTDAQAPATGPTPEPSKIEMPPAVSGEKRLAPPGVFYMIDRVSIEHATGIAAAVPGEKVKLMQRKENGIMKVTTGRYDFEVKESQVTNDLDRAQAVERQYALTHPVRR